jgi:endonuclease-3
MNRAGIATRVGRAREIVARLRREYPKSHTALNYRTPFELLAATMLSAQSTDKTVNRVTPALFTAYPHPAALAAAQQEEVEAIIHAAGFFRTKARHLIASAGIISRQYRGIVPQTMNELIALPGVARKTANIVLAQAFGRAEGIAVDTHVARLAQRLDLTREQRPEKIEQDLLRIIPRADWGALNTLLVDHGRAVCQARRPACAHCTLTRLCPKRGIFRAQGAD